VTNLDSAFRISAENNSRKSSSPTLGERLPMYSFEFMMSPQTSHQK